MEGLHAILAIYVPNVGTYVALCVKKVLELNKVISIMYQDFQFLTHKDFFIYKNPPILHHHLNPDQCTFALSSSIFLHMPKLFLQKSFDNLGLSVVSVVCTK